MTYPSNNINFIKSAIFILILVIYSALTQNLYAQVRAGSAYLKILPGTRQQSLASSLTGALDETYTLYANPGATGFLREWQWSASYNKWIADIFNLSLIYGKQLRFHTPWSDRLSVAFGLNYQDVGEFDATGGAQTPASAKDILVVASVGTPISVLTNNLSFGTNIKYLRSELAQYNSSSLIVDLGLIYRTPRIRLSHSNTGLFEYGILSAGVSLNQLGNSMNFISENTPLPRTFRAGLALNLGRHDGVQLQIAADYQKVRNESGQFSFGTEITNLLSPLSQNMGRLITLRGGYNSNNSINTDLVSKYSFGLSFRLDDYMMAPLGKVAPLNTELRFDFGMIESNIFQQVYQGSITNRPIRPEQFDFIRSEHQSFTAQDENLRTHTVMDTITLEWDATWDPDLYDEVNYMLMVSKDSSSNFLEQLIQKSKRNEVDIFKFDELLKYKQSIQPPVTTSIHSDSAKSNLMNGTEGHQLQDNLYVFVKDSTSFLVNNYLDRLSYKIYTDEGLEEGDYFWTVMAYDRNRHIRYIGKDGGHIAHFRVDLPDLQLTIMNQRKIGTAFYTDVLLKNSNRASVDDSFKVKIKLLSSLDYAKLDYEPVLVPGEFVISKPGFIGIPDTTNKLIFDSLEPVGITRIDTTLAGIAKGDSVWIRDVPLSLNRHLLVAVIDFEEKIDEFSEANNAYFDTLFVSDLQISISAVVPPLRPNVFFDPVGSFTLSDIAKKELKRISKAFKSSKFMDACLKINGHTDEQGFIGVTHTDSNKQKNMRLSLNRIASVKRFIVDSLGIANNRISTQAFGQGRPIIKNVTKRFAHLTKAARDSLHNINRRVEIYLLKKTCSIDSIDCTVIHQAGCVTDTIKSVNAEDEVEYELTIKNHGPFIAQNFAVRDIIPNFITASNFTPHPSGTKGDTLIWNIDSLPPGSEVTLKYTAQIDSVLPDTLIELINLSTLIAPNDFRQNNNSAIDTVYAIGGIPLQKSIPLVEQSIIHIVKKGEFLSTISQDWSKKLGYAISWRDIYEYNYVHQDSTNRQRIGKNPNLIKPGQVLIIPFE